MSKSISSSLSRAAPWGTLAWLVLASAGPALAQVALEPPETFSPIDANGVNLFSGQIRGPSHSVTIGQPGQGGLSVSYYYDSGNGGWRHSLIGTLSKDPIIPGSPGYSTPQFQLGVLDYRALYLRDTSDQFIVTDGTGTLVEAPLGLYTYTALDGTTATFDSSKREPGLMAQVVSVKRPNGETLTYHYAQVPTGQPLPMYARRLQSVTNNLGYQIYFQYATDVYGPDWTRLTKISGVNNAVDWCDPLSNTCTFSRAWPSITIGGTATDRTVTDATNNTTHYLFANGLLTGIRRPSQTAGNSQTYTRHSGPDHPNWVATVSDGKGTWTYGYSVPPPDPQNVPYYFIRATVTDPTGGVTRIDNGSWLEDPWGRRTTRLVAVTNAMNQATNWEWGGPGWQVSAVIQPAGNRLDYGYTERGDLESITRSKPGSGLAPTTVYATFDDCDTPVVCGRPTSITDSRLNVTQFTYDDNHGGILTETRPAPGPGPDRPQIRYTYQSLSAWYRTSAATTRVAGAPVTLPIEVSACASGTALTCVGTAQEVRTTHAYEAGNATLGSNLLPVTVTSGAGDGSLLATTTTTWDPNGDTRTVDGPLPGTADTTWYAYDLMRRNVGVIGPDPDGVGPLSFPATRTLYDPDGQPAEVRQGSTTAQSDTALAAMTVLAKVATTYDSQARPSKEIQALGSATVGVVQYSYDGEGRLRCTAVRMNPVVFGSLPTDACVQSTAGAYGQDRITRTSYDAADRPTEVEMGVGTSVAQVARLQEWTPNSQIDWVQDANGNRSDYSYDAFGRLVQLNFPSTTVGAQAASPIDYEIYGYDASDNVTSRRLRDGQTITITYDALNRETIKTVPGSGTANDVFTTYDLLDRRLSVTFTSAVSNDGVQWTWDALGRPVRERAGGIDLDSVYDLAGRRTALVWPTTAAGQIDFGWDLAGRMISASEGTPPLGPWANYTYDALGRPTQLLRVGGATTTWNYVPNSRDWSMTHNLAGTADDVTYALWFNPAGQVVGQDTSNPAWRYTTGAPPTSIYVRDGLNQYDSVGGSTFTHDARGNLTSDGVHTYVYDLENRLTSITGNSSVTTLQYDPLGRLRRIDEGTKVNLLQWDGDRLVAEFNAAGSLLARYIHGPGPDEPLAETGSPFRRWYLADPLRSIAAETDAAGALVGTPYTYDPYGRPDILHGYAGPRFRYTGQVMVTPQVGLWHYKARLYDPGIGRFLQTDPLGYEDSLNLYNYVGNDPINLTDPTGLYECDPKKTDCEEFERARRNARLAALRIRDPRRRAAALSVIDAYGELGEANGIVVEQNPDRAGLGARTVEHPNGRVFVYIDFTGRNEHARFEEIVSHEGTHLVYIAATDRSQEDTYRSIYLWEYPAYFFGALIRDEVLGRDYSIEGLEAEARQRAANGADSACRTRRCPDYTPAPYARGRYR